MLKKMKKKTLKKETDCIIFLKRLKTYSKMGMCYEMRPLISPPYYSWVSVSTMT